MPVVFIGIGSNLGDREGNCLRSIELMRQRGIAVIRQSSLYETEPWGVTEQPKFINMAVEAETSLAPRQLLNALKEIERQMGRTVTEKWGPRVIDLDILFYDDMIVDEPDLKIPHPLIAEREFVLRPLCEIAPDLKHPVTGRTIKEML